MPSRPRTLLFPTALLCALLFPSCGNGGAQSGSPAPAAAPGGAAPAAAQREQAVAMFETVCAACHGKSGMGDGPASATLTPKPRAFTDTEWQKSVTDEHIVKTITFGGAAVGKSPMMPAHVHLQGQNELLAALVQHIRSLAP